MIEKLAYGVWGEIDPGQMIQYIEPGDLNP